MNNALLSKDDVCELLRVSKSTLSRMCNRGVFPKGKAVFGRKIYWLRSVVEEFISKMFHSDDKSSKD